MRNDQVSCQLCKSPAQNLAFFNNRLLCAACFESQIRAQVEGSNFRAAVAVTA